MPGGQAADQHQIGQDVDVAGHGLPADRERRGQLRVVEQTTLDMGQHGPQATQGGRRNTGSEGRNVPFQVGRDEGFAPAQAGRIVRRQPRQREPTAHPERMQVGADCGGRQHFARLEGGQFQARYPSSQAFAGLLQQDAGGGAEKQELAGGFAIPPTDIDNAPQHGEQFRDTLHFVQDHQTMALGEQETLGIVQLTLGRGQFQVKIKRIAPPGNFGQSQRGLARLTRAQQDHRRELGE